MGDLTRGFDGLCFERPARACVSARQERVTARYVRSARSVIRVMKTTVGGFGR